MALFYLYKSRGITKDITILDGAGATINPADGDTIRAIIGREGKLGDDLSGAQFLITSAAPTENGSTFTKNSPVEGKNRLRIDAQDAALIPAGIYTLFVDLLDSDDEDDWKSVSREVLCVEET